MRASKLNKKATTRFMTKARALGPSGQYWIQPDLVLSSCSLIFILIYAKMWLDALTKDGENPSRGQVYPSIRGDYFYAKFRCISTPFPVASQVDESREFLATKKKHLGLMLVRAKSRLLSLGRKMQMVEIPRIVCLLISVVPDKYKCTIQSLRIPSVFISGTFFFLLTHSGKLFSHRIDR